MDKRRLKMKCSVAICVRESRAKGLCMAHYRRLNVYGDLEEDIPLRKSSRGLSFKERFDDKWIPVPESGCWLWIGTLESNGYGVAVRNNREDKIAAHRAAWEIYKGSIPDGLFVCHKCDVRSCVNPNHLFLGTTQDNTDDKWRKGRGPCGEKSGASKLTENDVREIRNSKETRRVIAAKFNISRSHITTIRSGKAWAHLK